MHVLGIQQSVCLTKAGLNCSSVPQDQCRTNLSEQHPWECIYTAQNALAVEAESD